MTTHSSLITNHSLSPEFFAVPVELWLSFDFDVACDFGLTREPEIFFVTEPGEKAERVQEQMQSLPESLFADVLDTVFNVNAAGTAQSHATAIEDFVKSRVDFDSGFAGFLAEIGSFGNLDCFLFLLERHRGHGICFRLNAIMKLLSRKRRLVWRSRD